MLTSDGQNTVLSNENIYFLQAAFLFDLFFYEYRNALEENETRRGYLYCQACSKIYATGNANPVAAAGNPKKFK